MKQCKTSLTIFIFAFFSMILLSGCSTPVLKDEQGIKNSSPEVAANVQAKALSDRELFEEALSLLSNGETEPKYNEAKIRLEELVLKYPKSKWAPGSQALIATVDKIASLQAQLKLEKQTAQNGSAKLQKEIEALKSNGRQADEKYAAELTRLQQENEKLKNDIQQLKKLEVQLEKREKMLR